MSRYQRTMTAFFSEIVASGWVYALKDGVGVPVSPSGDGRVAMPFWSSLAGVEAIRAPRTEDSGLVSVRIALAEFERAWLPGLARDGHLIGINWKGQPAKGFDIEPVAFIEHLERTRG